MSTRATSWDQLRAMLDQDAAVGGVVWRVVRTVDGDSTGGLCSVVTPGLGAVRDLGVTWEKGRKKWKAQIWREGRVIALGRFDFYADAIAAVHRARANPIPLSQKAE